MKDTEGSDKNEQRWRDWEKKREGGERGGYWVSLRKLQRFKVSRNNGAVTERDEIASFFFSFWGFYRLFEPIVRPFAELKLCVCLNNGWESR